METNSKEIGRGLPALAPLLVCLALALARPGFLAAQSPLALAQPALLAAQSPSPVTFSAAQPATPSEGSPASSAGAVGAAPSNPAFFPLSQIRPGMTGTAWTVFQGSKPEPMQVEFLGILRGARGPGQDLILARLHGEKPEYTGVVEGMSGSPVYIDGKLAGALSYRIGQFTKEPIAGITPIEQMLEVRDIPLRDLPMEDALATPAAPAADASSLADNQRPLAADPMDEQSSMTFQPLDTPLVMSGFLPEAVRFWQQQTAGTSLAPVAAGGSLGGMAQGASAGQSGSEAEAGAPARLEPGSAVSMQLIRGDLEVSATCTVTWVDPKQLLACGHPVLGAGPVSLPMTTADVVATLASPLNSFKIINTGEVIGAFTQDRASAIRGVFGAQAHMIPVRVAIDSPEGPRKVSVEVLDLPSLTPTAVQVVLYESLIESNQGSEALSYHVTGGIDIAGFPRVPVDLWAASAQPTPAPMLAAIEAGGEFTRLYSNGARRGVVRSIDLHVEAIPHTIDVQLDQARIASTDIAHAGDTITVEATLRPSHQPERNVRIAFKLPPRLSSGSLRVLVSDAATLDRTLLQPRQTPTPADLSTVLAEVRDQHAADNVYVSLLAPETQAEIHGQTYTSLPLSVANALEPLRNAQDAGLNGESAELVGEAPAGGVLSGFWILNLNIEPGGLN